MRIFFSKAQGGATLFEVLLVLAVAGLFLVLGIKLYQSFQTTLQGRELAYKVDQLFEAAGNYYKANCAAGDFSPRPPVFLSPYPVNTGTITYPPPATAYYPISIDSTLLPTGFLENWSPANFLVDASGGEAGYVVQLNPVVSTSPLSVNACVVLSPGTPCFPITPANVATPEQAYSAAPTSTIATTEAQVVTWVLQVAVKIASPYPIASYAALLGADCMSDSSGPGTVDPCSAGNSSHQYLVWSRLPTLATLKNNSIFSASTQLLKQYNLMYTHDQYNEFSGGYNTSQAPVYYLCGG